jgi:CRISPR system Cascade subunit CasB
MMSWLFERLHKHKDDRGMMANLRCVLVDNKKHRAWPALNRLGVKIDDEPSAYVAGFYATHPEETSAGNFGATCKTIEQKRGETHADDNKLTPTERRFQHLLTAENERELYNRLLRMVLMAKSEGVPINYAQLVVDLKSWIENDRIKTEWAIGFWNQSPTHVVEEDI